MRKLASSLRFGSIALVAFAAAATGPVAQAPAVAESTAHRAPAVTVDGSLAEWAGLAPQVRLDRKEQLLGTAPWSGPPDASAELRVAYDTNHLYLAGIVRDDQVQARPAQANVATDCLELFVACAAEDRGPTTLRPDDFRIALMPLSPGRPWWRAEGGERGAQSGSLLTGFRAAGKPVEGGYEFEAAIPFHHLPGLRAGAARVGLGLVLHDHDERAPDRALRLSWTGRDPTASHGLASLVFPGPGPLVDDAGGGALLPRGLLEDLPYLLAPLLAIFVLLLLLRGWGKVSPRLPWLRPVLLSTGVVLFVLGWFLPGMLVESRAGAQRQRLDGALDRLQGAIASLEQGTLASYRGNSRDRALMDLLAGKPIARQKYTSYRFLAELAPGEFGPQPRQYPDEAFAVRPYWLPLPVRRVETFDFDPPLRGEALYVVVGRPSPPAFPFPSRDLATPRLRFELDRGGRAGSTRVARVELDEPFVSASSLGRDAFEVAFAIVPIDGQLRSLAVAAEDGEDLRLVGISLLRARGEPVEPLSLGLPSLGGVLTDLRGPWPQDAGIELGPGAAAKVSLPPFGADPPQKLWLFYRATYPGLPTANPGARVGEVVLHFRSGAPPRRLVLEHQISMFYELVVQNTRDAPPNDSPAAIAFSWLDEAQEKHLNTVYPVLELPAGDEVAAIELKNLADYRVRFRSIVFGTEKAAAPQDPPDSPLVKEGQEKRLRDDVLAELRQTAVLVYRGGRLSESTLPPEQRQDLQALPPGLAAAGGAEASAVAELPEGGRRALLSAPLSGDGWDGAVLAVADTDVAWAAAKENGSFVGFALCLLAAPLLLVLFGELLASVANLRVRLMTVLTVGALAPLGVLSIVLVQVLEHGHAAGQDDEMRQRVAGAVDQLDEQKVRLRASAERWLRDLARLCAESTAAAPDAQFEAALAAAMPVLQKLLEGQLPPEWRGGSLKLVWTSTGGAGERHVAVAGDPALALADTPARLEPGLWLHFHELLLGVRAEEPLRGGTLALTAARPVNEDFLSALAPGKSVLLADVRGYPLAAVGARPDAETLMRHALRPAVMAARERALLTALDQRQPAVERADDADLLWGSEALRDLQDTPRALLVVAEPDQRATLDLALGRITVRGFFLFVAGLLVVLSVFLSFVVSSRISRPIEELERGALALSRGALDVRVAAEEGGQIGRLTRAFNRMASDLQARLLDLQGLNRTTRDLSAQLDVGHTVDVLLRFCERHAAADRVRVVLLDPDGARIESYGGGEVVRGEVPAELAFLKRALGPFCVRGFAAGPREVASGAPAAVVPAANDERSLRALLPGVRSAIGLPLVLADRCRGAVLLGFEREDPSQVDLELLSTGASQAAVALENAQLYRHAVQDPVTGAYTPEYFRRRAADEVSIAQQRGRGLVLLGLQLGDGDRRPRGLRRFAALLREVVPAGAAACHEGAGRFLLLAPGLDRAAGETLLRSVAEAWLGTTQKLPENEAEERPPATALVAFPEEAASAEFLFDALRDRLRDGAFAGPGAEEADASLRREGVVAVSPAMREVYRTLRRVAATDLTILLEGETGTGKEVLTNLLHRWSRRAGGPLVKVHCAALSETLLASELFGHEKGSFTGAERRKVGRFEQADGGTIFLDEVGEIPLDVQVKLLRVLQEREVDRVGGTVPIKVDVRVVAATNKDLARLVAEGRFREDLYYRLQGMLVRVPPLRERKQEIPALVEHFRAEVTAAGQSQVRAFSTDAMDELFRRDWPGNVRELRNAVFRAMVLASGDVVQLRDVLAAQPTTLAAASQPPVAAGSAMAIVSPAAMATAAGNAPPTSPPATVTPATMSPSAALPPSIVPPLAVPLAHGSPLTGLPGALLPPAAIPSQSAEAERVFVLPSPGAPSPAVGADVPGNGDAGASGGSGESPPGAVDLAALPPRLQRLYAFVLERGSVGTTDHMTVAGVSHRTGLRDLQLLVQLGLLERLGKRRGARYRPRARPDERVPS